MTWGVIQYHFGDRDGLLMAVVAQGFSELMATLRALPPPSASMNTLQRVEPVVTAAWEAMSGATSRAAIEILIGTRATRGAGAAGHLDRLARTFRELVSAVGADLDSTQSAALGNLLLTNLRGLVATQLIMARPVDTARDRSVLAEVIAAYIDRNG